MNAHWLKYLPSALREKLAGHHELQAILGNSGWLFADKVVRMGVGLIVGVWLARYLGPERFGKFNYAIAFVALFTPIAALGVDGIVVRELIRYPERKDEILGSAFALKLGGGLLAFTLALAAIFVFHPGEALDQWLVGIIAAGVIFQAFDIADLWFQSRVQSRFSVMAKNGAFLALTLAKIWLILAHGDLIALALVSTAELALAALGLFVAFGATGNRWLDLRPLRRIMGSCLRESWPLFLSALAGVLYQRIDQVMLAETSGAREVGLYSAAVRLSEVWYLVPPAVVSSVMPYLTAARAKSKEVYYQHLQQLLIVLARIAYAVVVPVALLAGPLMRLIYGDAYAEAGTVLAIHIWSVLFVFLGAGAAPWIINERFTRLALYQTGLGAVSNIALNLYLIPRYGAIGAAVATVCSQCVSVWLANLAFVDGRAFFCMQARAMALGIRIGQTRGARA